MSDYAEVYLISHPKARKSHKCCECRGQILAKEEYFYHHGVFDGSGFGHKLCQDCHNLHFTVKSQDKSEDFECPVGYLHEYVFESRDLNLIKTFLQIKEKRKAVIPDWMTDRFDELANEQDEKVIDNGESPLYDSNEIS